MYTDQNLLQIDDVCLKLDLCEVVTTCVWLAELTICAVVCLLNSQSCAANKIIFAVALMPCSLVQTPPYVSTNCFDDVGVRVATVFGRLTTRFL